MKAGVFFDGVGSPAQRRIGVLIRGETIASVGPLDAVTLPTDAPVRELDLLDSTVLPGMIDCHLHLGYHGHRTIQELEWPKPVEYHAIWAGENARKVLSCGFTSGLDVGSRGEIGVAVTFAMMEEGLPGPRLRVSGQILSTTNSVVELWPNWMQVAPHARLGVSVSGPDEVREVVGRQVKTGVDNIKVEATGTGAHTLGQASEATMTPAELGAAVEAAHQYGVSVAAHAERTTGIKNAIRARVDTVQHGTFLDEEVLDLLEQHPDSRLVVTTACYEGIVTIGPTIGYPPAGLQRFTAAWPRIIENVRLAYGGMPIEHAIRSVTSYAAVAGWFENTGALQPGRFADVVGVHGDLTQAVERIEDEAAIRLVMQRGRIAKLLEPAAATARAAAEGALSNHLPAYKERPR